MSDRPIAATSFCVVEGCSGEVTGTRLVTTGTEQRAIDVCEKHETGEIDINRLDLGDWGE